MRKYLIVLVGYCLIGCSNMQFPGIYRLPIEQGNIITQEMIDQLKPGMSRSQVEYIMGTPLIKDSFNEERWDYVYSLRRGNLKREQKSMTIYFDDDKMTSFSGDYEPTPASAESLNESGDAS